MSTNLGRNGIFAGMFECLSCKAHWHSETNNPWNCMFRICPNCDHDEFVLLGSARVPERLKARVNIIRTERSGTSPATVAGRASAKRHREWFQKIKERR